MIFSSSFQIYIPAAAGIRGQLSNLKNHGAAVQFES